MANASFNSCLDRYTVCLLHYLLHLHPSLHIKKIIIDYSKCYLTCLTLCLVINTDGKSSIKRVLCYKVNLMVLPSRIFTEVHHIRFSRLHKIYTTYEYEYFYQLKLHLDSCQLQNSLQLDNLRLQIWDQPK